LGDAFATAPRPCAGETRGRSPAGDRGHARRRFRWEPCASASRAKPGSARRRPRPARGASAPERRPRSVAREGLRTSTPTRAPRS
jgi:hypothetical protein